MDSAGTGHGFSKWGRGTEGSMECRRGKSEKKDFLLH
jgi:hypothetical protein